VKGEDAALDLKIRDLSKELEKKKLIERAFVQRISSQIQT